MVQATVSGLHLSPRSACLPARTAVLLVIGTHLSRPAPPPALHAALRAANWTAFFETKIYMCFIQNRVYRQLSV